MPDFSKEKKYALFDGPLNKKTIGRLAAENIETIVFPRITTAPTESFEIEPLEQFDWLVFPDVYAAEYFVGALEEAGIDLFELDALRVLAYGEAVADRLRFSQLHADVIPPTIKTRDVRQALTDYVFDESEFASLSFLILHEAAAKVDLADELLALGAKVTQSIVYSAAVADESEIPRLKALLKGGAIDEFIFSSYFDVLNLAQLFQTENLSELLDGITLTAVDGHTQQSLIEFRLSER